MKDPDLLLQHAPFLGQTMTTRRVMFDVVLALLPATFMGLWYFGLGAGLILLASMTGALLTEWFFTRHKPNQMLDGSGLVTGLLLGLTLPPALPLWMAFLGGAAAIGLGKVIWGGLGHNLFNPALLGRAFLMATFPVAMTSWASPVKDFFTVSDSILSIPFTYQSADGITAATPLGMMKFEAQTTPLLDLMLGHTSGSIGETSGLLLLAGGLYLWYRRDLEWRIPTGILISAALFSALLYVFDPEHYPSAPFTLFSGGLLLGAFFMATDPVTSPTTPMGCWIFAISIGLLVVLIRVFGGLPEGVMYAILLMNAASPLIERFSQPRVFGRDRELS